MAIVSSAAGQGPEDLAGGMFFLHFKKIPDKLI